MSDRKSYGTVSQTRKKALRGLDLFQDVMAGTLPLNTMAETLDYDIAEARRGCVIVTATPKASHLHPAGTVHSGLCATLLDSGMGLAI